MKLIASFIVFLLTFVVTCADQLNETTVKGFLFFKDCLETQAKIVPINTCIHETTANGTVRSVKYT